MCWSALHWETHHENSWKRSTIIQISCQSKLDSLLDFLAWLKQELFAQKFCEYNFPNICLTQACLGLLERLWMWPLVVRGDYWWTTYIHTNWFTIGVSGTGRYANIFEFIKTNYQYIEMLIKLHNIFIKLGILYGMLYLEGALTRHAVIQWYIYLGILQRERRLLFTCAPKIWQHAF